MSGSPGWLSGRSAGARGARSRSGRTARAVRAVVSSAAIVAVLTTAACGDGSSKKSSSSSREITVSAAASLTEPFTEIAHQFEAQHKGVKVTLNFGGSAQLAQQIVSGAPADVFAAASTATMRQASSKIVGEPAVFTRNFLQIAVPAANPGKVTGLADFARKDLRLAVCLEQVPCGAAAKQVFAAAHLNAQPDSFEEDVKAVLTKVELGEVDAGLVYRTDILAAGEKVRGIEFPEAVQAVNDYLIATVSDSPDAKQFVQFVRSDAGRGIMAKAGFQAP